MTTEYRSTKTTVKTVEELPQEETPKQNDEVLENNPETFQRLIDEANDWKDKFYRQAAEADNLKKRVERDKQKAITFANEKIAKDLLETLDNFEKALDVEMPGNVGAGIMLVQQGLQKTLQKHGVVECPMGDFDPNFHEAVSVVDSDGTSNQIVEVLRKGYLLNNRLLRAATVVISK